MLPVAYLPELFIKARGEYDGEIFFVAGLPHDIDRLVMCLKAPDQLRVVLDFAKKSGDRWHKAEAKYFGFDHGAVGRALLRAWNLPKISQEAFAHHNFPTSAQNFPLEAATVHLADNISHHVVAEPDSDDNRFCTEKCSWEAVQLSEDLHLEQIIEQVETQFEDVSQVFLQPT